MPQSDVGQAPARRPPGAGPPSATTSIGGKIERNRHAASRSPTGRRASCRPRARPTCCLIMTDDVGFGVAQHLRRRDPDAGAGPHRQERPALHQLPLHGAVLADPGGADHRAQPSFGRLRRGRRAGDGLSRLRQHHHQGQGHHRQDPEGQRLPHLVVRQEPQHAGLPGQRRTARSTSGPSAWASSTSTASWAATPTSGSRRTSSATRRTSIPSSATRRRTSPPRWPTRPSPT